MRRNLRNLRLQVTECGVCHSFGDIAIITKPLDDLHHTSGQPLSLRHGSSCGLMNKESSGEIANVLDIVLAPESCFYNRPESCRTIERTASLETWICDRLDSHLDETGRQTTGNEVTYGFNNFLSASIYHQRQEMYTFASFVFFNISLRCRL